MSTVDLNSVSGLLSSIIVAVNPSNTNNSNNTRTSNVNPKVKTQKSNIKVNKPAQKGVSNIINYDTRALLNNYSYRVRSNTNTSKNSELIQADIVKIATERYKESNPYKEKTSIRAESHFYLNFTDSAGVNKFFVFSLMPAIENSMRGSAGGINVPEVKPGITFRTDMNTKRITVPGSPPIFQSLSIDKTTLQIVAALIGNESVVKNVSTPTDSTTKTSTTTTTNTPTNKTSTNKTSTKSNPVVDSIHKKSTNLAGNELFTNTGAYGVKPKVSFDANSSAFYIDTQIVQTGRPITLTLVTKTTLSDADTKIKIRGLITSFRYMLRYADKAYYSLDIVLLDYLDKGKENILRKLGGD